MENQKPLAKFFSIAWKSCFSLKVKLLLKHCGVTGATSEKNHFSSLAQRRNQEPVQNHFGNKTMLFDFRISVSFFGFRFSDQAKVLQANTTSHNSQDRTVLQVKNVHKTAFPWSQGTGKPNETDLQITCILLLGIASWFIKFYIIPATGYHSFASVGHGLSVQHFHRKWEELICKWFRLKTESFLRRYRNLAQGWEASNSNNSYYFENKVWVTVFEKLGVFHKTLLVSKAYLWRGWRGYR